MQAETSGAASDRRGFKWRRVRHLSVRDGVSGNFYITGSATGGLPELTPTDCVRVVAYDVAKNWLRYEGAAIPSSESLTHAAIYESDPTISAVIHCHDSVLWRTCLDRVPTTSKAIAYGTPENGVRNHAPVHGERCAKQRDFRHGGTRRRHCDFRKKSRRRIRCCDARTRVGAAVRCWPAICRPQRAECPRSPTTRGLNILTSPKSVRKRGAQACCSLKPT